MNNKKILIVLSVIALTLLFIGAVSAADNTTTDTVKIKEKENNNEETISETQIQSTKSNAISNVNTNKDVSKSDESKALKTNNPKTKSVSKPKKNKVVLMNVKYRPSMKKFGKYIIKARLYKVPYFQRYTNYLDIHLYKNGKHVKSKDYLSTYKFKVNGKWKWYPRWRHGGVPIETFHRYVNDNPIIRIALKITVNDVNNVNKVNKINNVNKVNTATKKPTKTFAGKKVFTITIPVQKIKEGTFFKIYRLKTAKDKICCVYSTVNNAMMKKGISIDTQISRGYYVSQARLIKVKIAFKNRVTNKILYKFYTKTNKRHDAMKLIKVPTKYLPLRATIWYCHK
ncbi:hypothetical protein [uncultured Methanobrevibacter sp.]|uniref:hypothetical protein n=1 Tax=uncultured Methanobrevibacter sp. TaxID=253161 RepID=UPI0025D2DD7C|nr:hypothetical protein [uncultured Methanobrevibacter sp.]